MSYAPEIKLDHNCRKIDVSWQRFDELDALIKVDLLKNLMEIFIEKYYSAYYTVMDNKGILLDLHSKKEMI